jgi:aerobic carbon-monoxide dehydrogenase small subunit
MTATTMTETTDERPLVTIETTVNGQAVRASIEPRTTLLDFLRDTLNLKGAKRSCDLQVCGACTVLVDGTPMSSCCTLAYEANGKQVTTIEGLSRHGSLDPVQQAFIEVGAVQCGFCTSGMILSAKSLLAENPRPTRDEITAYLGGNLCRCTGYWRIREAIERASEIAGGADQGEAS